MIGINKKGVAGIELSIYLISIFAFAFVLGGGEFVSGAEYGKPGEYYMDNDGGEVVQITDWAGGCIGCHLRGQPGYTNFRKLTSEEVKRLGAKQSGGTNNGGIDFFYKLQELTQGQGSQRQDSSNILTGGKTPFVDSNANDFARALSGSEGSWANVADAGSIIDGRDQSAWKTGTVWQDAKGDIFLRKGDNEVEKWVKGTAGGSPGPLGDKGKTGSTGKTADIFSKMSSGLVEGIVFAAAAFGAGQAIGSLIGFNSDQTLALSAGLGAGAFAFKLAGSAGLEGIAQLGAGLGVGALVFILMYKDVEVKIVSFECNAWQAPNGGNDCEICNDDSLPCSEYRCRSLGQNCEIVNAGTEQERCVNVNPQDVNPPVITPNEIDLTFGHSYTDVKNSPPGPGFKITRLDSSDGCLKAFTPLKFGVTTNEPAQCKIDFNHTTTFDEMASYMGGNNMYLYNHSEVFALPGAKAFEGSPFVLDNGKDLNFFIRCQDKNGNFNSAEYNVRFCMDPTPDTTAPIIKATSIINNGCVAENVNYANVDFYTDEPADCKWSHTDQSYDIMQNEMECSMNLYQINAEKLFTCSANLTGIARDNTSFYVRCKDQPGMAENDRNKNEQSFMFNLHGSGALKMRNTAPNGTIFGGVSPAPIELYTETLFGCDAGKAVCYYSQTGNLNDYIMFFDTNKADGIHTQRQDVSAGDHDYFIKCVDSGGNVATQNITFNVDIDTSAPVIARAYQESGNLKIVTIRNSQCAYSKQDCDFTFEEGTEMPFANSTVHVAEWKNDETYYIKCRDEFRNEEASCSIVVRPGRDLF